jgi:hypothetical protein
VKIIKIPAGAGICCCGPPRTPRTGPCEATGATWNGLDFALIQAADAPTCGPGFEGQYVSIFSYEGCCTPSRIFYLDVSGNPDAGNFQHVYLWSDADAILHVTSCSETGDDSGIFTLDDSQTACDALVWIADEAELSYSIGTGGTIRLTR